MTEEGGHKYKVAVPEGNPMTPRSCRSQGKVHSSRRSKETTASSSGGQTSAEAEGKPQDLAAAEAKQ